MKHFPPLSLSRAHSQPAKAKLCPDSETETLAKQACKRPGVSTWGETRETGEIQGSGGGWMVAVRLYLINYLFI